MIIYEHFNQNTAVCPICGTRDDKPGTILEVNEYPGYAPPLMMPFHLECLNPSVNIVRDGKILVIMDFVVDPKK